MTLIAGVGLLGDCALHAAMAILLPTPIYLLATAGIHVLVLAGVALAALFVLRHRPRSLSARPHTEDPDRVRA